MALPNMGLPFTSPEQKDWASSALAGLAGQAPQAGAVGQPQLE